jgi:predicted transcriptional regulator
MRVISTIARPVIGYSGLERDILIVLQGKEPATVEVINGILSDYYFSELTKQHLSKVLKGLSEQGLLQQQATEEEYEYFITNSGEQLIRKHRDWQNQFYSQMGRG